MNRFSYWSCWEAQETLGKTQILFLIWTSQSSARCWRSFHGRNFQYPHLIPLCRCNHTTAKHACFWARLCKLLPRISIWGSIQSFASSASAIWFLSHLHLCGDLGRAKSPSSLPPCRVTLWRFQLASDRVPHDAIWSKCHGSVACIRCPEWSESALGCSLRLESCQETATHRPWACWNTQ